MILELYGCPGSGKTYFITKLKGKDNVTEKVDKCFIRKRLACLLKKCVCYTPSAIMLKWQMKMILKNEAGCSVYFHRSYSEFFNSLAMMASIYKYLKIKDLYVDEGIIHRIVTMAVNYQLNIKIVFRIADLLQKYLKGVNIYYLDVPIENCIESIRKRDRHESAMDEFNEVILEKFLKSYKFYFDEITKRYGYKKIERNSKVIS